MDAMGTVAVDITAKVRRIKRMARALSLVAFLWGTIVWSLDLGAFVAYRHVSPMLVAWPVLVTLGVVVVVTVWVPFTVSIRQAEREHVREQGRLLRIQAYMDAAERTGQ